MKPTFERKWIKFWGMTTEVKIRQMTFFIFIINLIGFEFQTTDYLKYDFFTRFLLKLAHYKNWSVYQFPRITIKNDFENVSAKVEFRFENSLKSVFFFYYCRKIWTYLSRWMITARWLLVLRSYTQTKEIYLRVWILVG